jgi:3-deoxy-D-manno-octulosonate cytidylyltransferase
MKGKNNMATNTTLLEDLEGKPVIVRTYEAVKDTGLFDLVYVVTDDLRIQSAVENAGAKTLMPKGHYATGSDRIAAAAKEIEGDIIINIQGDEPFINKGLLQQLIETFHNNPEQNIEVVSAVFPITDAEEIKNPNNVKVVLDNNNFALYFSRLPIPYSSGNPETTYYQHIGVYAFRRESLIRFASLPQSPLEKSEKLENLRFLSNGMTVKMIITSENSVGIDTPEDLDKARIKWREKNL